MVDFFAVRKGRISSVQIARGVREEGSKTYLTG